MNPAPRISGLLTPVILSLFRPLKGKTWLATATVGVCAIVGIAAHHLWQHHSDQILAQPEYRLDVEKLTVTDQPDWIRTDIKENAVIAGRLNEANLVDSEFVLQVKQAFGVQPWVKQVLRVNKIFPSTVEVELQYRRPVAMVEVPAGMFPGYDYEGLLPVDDEGYLLPVEISEQEAQQYPKIGGIDSSPAGPPGSPWGDTRVAEAAQIVVLLEEIWKPLELYRIDVPARHSPTETTTHGDFVLITRKQIPYKWGSAPGKERRGEERARSKAEGLRTYLEKRGPLDASQDEQLTTVSELIGRRQRR